MKYIPKTGQDIVEDILDLTALVREYKHAAQALANENFHNAEGILLREAQKMEFELDRKKAIQYNAVGTPGRDE